MIDLEKYTFFFLIFVADYSVTISHDRFLSPRKFYIRRNNSKVDSIETGRRVIALEKCMYDKILSSLLNS